MTIYLLFLSLDEVAIEEAADILIIWISYLNKFKKLRKKFCICILIANYVNEFRKQKF